MPDFKRFAAAHTKRPTDPDRRASTPPNTPTTRPTSPIPRQPTAEHTALPSTDSRRTRPADSREHTEPKERRLRGNGHHHRVENPALAGCASPVGGVHTERDSPADQHGRQNTHRGGPPAAHHAPPGTANHSPPAAAPQHAAAPGPQYAAAPAPAPLRPVPRRLAHRWSRHRDRGRREEVPPGAAVTRAHRIPPSPPQHRPHRPASFRPASPSGPTAPVSIRTSPDTTTKVVTGVAVTPRAHSASALHGASLSTPVAPPCSSHTLTTGFVLLDRHSRVGPFGTPGRRGVGVEEVDLAAL